MGLATPVVIVFWIAGHNLNLRKDDQPHQQYGHKADAQVEGIEYGGYVNHGDSIVHQHYS